MELAKRCKRVGCPKAAASGAGRVSVECSRLGCAELEVEKHAKAAARVEEAPGAAMPGGERTVVSEEGGRRSLVLFRLDWLPGLGLKAIGEIAAYGGRKHGPLNYLKTDPETQSAWNHGLGHAAEAFDLAPGSPERIDAMARTAFNAMIQIELELRAAGRLEGPLTATGARDAGLADQPPINADGGGD